MAEKLVDRVDILNNLINDIMPRYFDEKAMNHNRTSVYGYLSESEAKSIEDTITLEQRRAIDYCPELSSSPIRVRQTAKIRGVDIAKAEPSKAFAILGILKRDVINRGTKRNNEITFRIDRRSSIVHDGIPFSLEDDILIRAVRKANGYVYSASYSGEHTSYQSYIQMFEQKSAQGEELVTMLVQIYQCDYNIQEKVVTDVVTFMYEGLEFDYDNLLAGFEVYYKRTVNDEYKKAELDHYLTMETSKALFYNDDDSGLIKILNNPALNIGVNTMIRIEIKETLGTEGVITMDDGNTTFSLFRDEDYNYAGVNILVSLVTNSTEASNGDTLLDIKKRLIDAKTRRDNITTEHDIVSYINDVDANVQVIKKRNDVEDRRVYMYTLLRHNGEIVPATTKRLHLLGIQSVTNNGHFDVYDRQIDRKVLRAYSRFKLVVPEGYPEEEEFAIRVNHDEMDLGAFYYTCPFMIILNDLNIASYYFTTINEEVLLNGRVTQSMFPFQLVARSINIRRDSHDPDENDIYYFNLVGTLNTSNDADLLDEDGKIADMECMKGYILWRNNSTVVGYLPLVLDSYDNRTREFLFTGSMKTNDFITTENKLQIVEGLYQSGTTKRFNSVIDFKDGQFDVVFMYKYDDTEGIYPKTDIVHQYVPIELTDGYCVMNNFYNETYNPYNLVLEFSKFTSSPVKVTPYSETTVYYDIGEVPFIEYEYGIENIVDMYDDFKNMMNVYNNLLKLTTDFDISLKFTSTYGRSKYIYVSGGRNADGEENTVELRNLNPKFYFKVYGQDAPIEDIRDYIYEYLRDTYITEQRVFISNICTLVERNFTKVNSIKFIGVDDLDGSYQEFNYITPEFNSLDVITRFVPEQFNVTDIQIELDED